MLGEVAAVRRLEEPPAGEDDDAGVGFGADEAPGALDDARHPGDDVRVLEAALEALLEVAPHALLLEPHHREGGRDDHDGLEHLAGVVDALRERAARNGEEQDGRRRGPSGRRGPVALELGRAVGGAEDAAPGERREVRAHVVEEPVRREEREDVARAGARHVRDESRRCAGAPFPRAA